MLYLYCFNIFNIKIFKFAKQPYILIKIYKLISVLILSNVVHLYSTAQKTPPLFEENNGQFVAFKGSTTNQVLFQANLPGLCIWVTQQGLTYNFYKQTSNDSLVAPATKINNANQTVEWYRSEMLLKNATLTKYNLIKKNKVSFNKNYIIASNNQIQANLYEEIYFTNIYQGIDWRIFIENNQIKQEFIVQPFANANLINLEYVSTGNIDVKNNEIILSNKLGVFTEGKLLCYQDNIENTIDSKYICTAKSIENTTIKKYAVKVETKNYNNNKPLVIDPTLQWSTFYGGTNDEDGHVIYSDGTNTWVGGHSLSFNFPTLNPGSSAYYQGSNSGGFGDAFILKMSNTGSLIWATYFGGSSNDETLAIHSNGTNVWVAGFSGSTDFPVLNPGGGAFFQGSNAGNIDGFILKFTNSGVLQWSTYCGGVNGDYISAIHYNNNELYVGANSASSNYPVFNSGSFFQTYTNANDGVVMKFSPANNLLWSTFIGGTGNDYINTIQTNSTSIFIAGQSGSTNFNVLNASTFYQATNNGNSDGFISKFTLAGNLNWSTYFGGNSSDQINSLTLTNNALWLTGTSNSTNMPVFNTGGGAFFQGATNGGSDGFISKFNLLGTLQWSTYYGGSLTDYLTGITTDGKNAFVCGYSNSSTLTTVNPGGNAFFQGSNGGFFDGVLLKFDTTSACTWGSFFGNASNDYLYSINCDISKILITGYSQSIILPTLNPGGGAYYQSTNAGGLDAIITSFKNCIKPTLLPTINNPVCAGGNLSLNTNTFVGANYQWFGPQSFYSTLQNPVITNCSSSNSGNYSLIVDVPYGCNQATVIPVTVNPQPTVTASNNSPICSGNVLVLNSSLATTYTWSGVAGFTSAVQSPTIANASNVNSGIYTLTISDGIGCTNTATTNAIVNVTLAVSISNNNPLCVGGNLILNGSSANSYTWAGVSGFTSSIQSPTIVNTTTLNSGNYTLTASNGVGCTNTTTISITINSLPIVSSSANQTICANSPINLTGNGGQTFYWSGPNSYSSSLQNPTISNTSSLNAGTYTLTGFNTSGCSNTASTTVFVNASPVVSISVNSVVCVGSSINLNGTGGQSYLWTGPNSFSTTNQNQIITNVALVNQGYYVITVTGTNTCTKSDSVYVTVTNCANLKEMNSEVVFEVFPNPSSNVLYFKSAKINQNTDYIISLFGADGKCVLKQKYNSTLNINTLPKGLYILIVTSESQIVYTKKIIKS